jgi:hypothetical protein
MCKGTVTIPFAVSMTRPGPNWFYQWRRMDERGHRLEEGTDKRLRCACCLREWAMRKGDRT